jgi:hypothetical protein
MAGRTRRGSNDLNAAERNAMPEREYAFPRERKEPLNDASHVRNAIARFDQVRDVSDEERREAFRRIKRAAGRFGVELTASRWQDLGKPTAGMKSSDRPRSKEQMYNEAKRRNIRGRSSMTKAELERALRG